MTRMQEIILEIPTPDGRYYIALTEEGFSLCERMTGGYDVAIARSQTTKVFAHESALRFFEAFNVRTATAKAELAKARELADVMKEMADVKNEHIQKLYDVIAIYEKALKSFNVGQTQEPDHFEYRCVVRDRTQQALQTAQQIMEGK